MVRLWEDLDLGPRSASIILLTLGITSHTWADGLHRRLRTGDPGGSALLGAAWLLAVVFRFWVITLARGQRDPLAVADGERRPYRRSLAAGGGDAGPGGHRGDLSRCGGGPIAANWLSIKLILVAVAVALTFGTRLVLPSVMVVPAGTGRRNTRRRGSPRPVVWSLALTAVGWVCIAVVIWLSIAKI